VPPTRAQTFLNCSGMDHCTHTRLTALFSGNTQVNRYQKGKTNLDFTGARDSECQWHQLGHTQVCTSLQTDNHASTPPLSFLQAGCPSCRPTKSVKALKAHITGFHFVSICIHGLLFYGKDKHSWISFPRSAIWRPLLRCKIPWHFLRHFKASLPMLHYPYQTRFYQ